VSRSYPRSRILLGAATVYLLWTVATYVLEGRILTFARPEAVVDRLVYIVIANLLIGVVGATLFLRFSGQKLGVATANVGFRGRWTVLSVLIGAVLGFTLFVLQSPPTTQPVVLANVFAQVLAVSIAEVMVCWVVVGNAVTWAATDWPRVVTAIVSILSSAILFGLYHFAHSPPFNSIGMVLLLTGVGVGTGLFYFVVREVYGTIVFHNFFAMFGITQSLAESGQIDHYSDPQYPLFLTAAVSILMLILTERVTLRRKK